LLVAPVLHEGARNREVYLPAATTWTDAWTNETLAGGQWITADAPLERIPLFLHEEAKLPIYETRQNSNIAEEQTQAMASY
jgi:alpha-D-xyloside xylohydrolase